MKISSNQPLVIVGDKKTKLPKTVSESIASFFKDFLIEFQCGKFTLNHWYINGSANLIPFFYRTSSAESSPSKKNGKKYIYCLKDGFKPLRLKELIPF